MLLEYCLVGRALWFQVSGAIFRRTIAGKGIVMFFFSF